MPIRDENPYEPTAILDEPPGKTQLHRYRASAIVLAAISVLAAWLDLSGTVRYVYEGGDLRNTWVQFVLHAYFLGVASLGVFVELKGRARSMRFLPIALVPLVALTLLIVIGFATAISDYLTVDWMMQNPSPVLGWLMCPIVWCYFCQSVLRRRRTPVRIAGEA